MGSSKMCLCILNFSSVFHVMLMYVNICKYLSVQQYSSNINLQLNSLHSARPSPASLLCSMPVNGAVTNQQLRPDTLILFVLSFLPLSHTHSRSQSLFDSTCEGFLKSIYLGLASQLLSCCFFLGFLRQLPLRLHSPHCGDSSKIQMALLTSRRWIVNGFLIKPKFFPWFIRLYIMLLHLPCYSALLFPLPKN